METTADGASETRFHVLHVAGLMAVPLIALALMLAHTLAPGAHTSAPKEQQSAPAPKFTAELNRRLDGPYTLYVFAGDSAKAALDEAELSANISRSEHNPHWFAWVNTPDEEAQLIKIWDDANWIRSDLGLPAIKFVDLRDP